MLISVAVFSQVTISVFCLRWSNSPSFLYHGSGAAEQRDGVHVPQPDNIGDVMKIFKDCLLSSLICKLMKKKVKKTGTFRSI